MKTFTLNEARSAAQSGGVLNANLKPIGGSFSIEFETRNGAAVLIASVSKEIRRFSNPIKAFEIIKNLGLDGGRFSLAQWSPGERELDRQKRPDRAIALREAHEAAAYNTWLTEKVTASRKGLADGSNERIAPDAWNKVRAEKRMNRAV